MVSAGSLRIVVSHGSMQGSVGSRDDFANVMPPGEIFVHSVQPNYVAPAGWGRYIY
jgi:hypothetical protein